MIMERWQTSGWICALAMACAWCSPVAAQNLLLNSSFEDGTGTAATNWTFNNGNIGAQTAADETGWFNVGPRTGTRFIGLVTNGNNNFTGRATQTIPVSAGHYALKLSFWGKIHDSGGTRNNDNIIARLRVDGGLVQEISMSNRTGEDSYQLVEGVAWEGQVNSEIEIRIVLQANTDGNGGWGVLAVDDVSLEIDPVQRISPNFVLGNATDTNATIYSSNLSGTPTVKLVRGATELVGTNVVVAGDGNSLTATFPTTGAPFNTYNVVIDTGSNVHTQIRGFALRDPSANLLNNGDFESGPAGQVPAGWTAWAAWWEGINDIRAYNNPSIFNPSPLVYEGALSLREQEGGSGDGGLTRTVRVVPGETLELSWVWAGGNTNANPGDASHVTGVFSGQLVNTHELLPDIAFRSKGGGIGDWNWEADSLTFVVPEDLYEITVDLRTFHLDSLVATYWDNVTLRSTGGCVDQHSVTSVSPSQVQLDQPFTLTLTGTNLNLVSSVRLFQGGVSHYGTNLQASAGGSMLTASFTPPEGGWLLGTYSIITEQTGCATQTVPSALEVVCGAPVSFTGVTPNVLVKPQGVVQLTVLGSNVASLSEVKLVYVPPARPEGDPRPPFWIPVTEVVGTVVDDSNPDAVVMSFDLYNATYRYGNDPTVYTGSAQAGMYKLVGTTGTGCPAPAELLNAFELQLPSGDNAIANPGFEDGVLAPWTLVPEVGMTDKGDPFPGAEFVYAPLGTPWNSFYPHGGNYMVGLAAINDGTWEAWSTPNKGYLRQNLGLPNGPGEYRLTLSFWVRMFDDRPPGSLLKASIIADGETAPNVSSITARLIDLPFMSTDGFDPYTQLSVDFIGNVNNNLAVEFYFEGFAEGAGWGQTSVVTVDDIQLVGVTTCGTPPADMDGDLDVDQEDFGLFQLCYTGSFPGQNLEGACRCVDSDSDGDVDAADLAAFNACALTSGPSIPANCP